MLKKFFSYYKPHKRLFIIDFSSAIFVALLELAFPVAVQWFIDDLLPIGELGTNHHNEYSIVAHLFTEYIPSIYRQLSWSQTRHQYRNRYAPATVQPCTSAIIPIFRQHKNRSYYEPDYQ